MNFYVARNRRVQGDYEAVAVARNGAVTTVIDGEEVEPAAWFLVLMCDDVHEAQAEAKACRDGQEGVN